MPIAIFPIRDLAAKIGVAMGYKGLFTWDATKPNGQPRRGLDTSRAREWFGFIATLSGTRPLTES